MSCFQAVFACWLLWCLWPWRASPSQTEWPRDTLPTLPTSRGLRPWQREIPGGLTLWRCARRRRVYARPTWSEGGAATAQGRRDWRGGCRIPSGRNGIFQDRQQAQSREGHPRKDAAKAANCASANVGNHSPISAFSMSSGVSATPVVAYLPCQPRPVWAGGLWLRYARALFVLLH